MNKEILTLAVKYCILSFIPAIMYLNNSILERFLGITGTKIVMTTLVALTLITVATELIKYLNKDIGKDSHRKNTSTDNDDYLKNEILALRKEVEKLSNNQIKYSQAELSEGQQEELIQEIKKKIAGRLILDASLDLKKDIQNIREQVSINDHYENMVIRIKSEIDRVNRRGGSNLGIGSVIALFGMFYLGYAVANQPGSNNMVEYVIHMIPRISFVLVIEIFAYFFLKLYRNGFDEVKYFQNELTNIEAKVLAIKFLRDVKNEELMSEVIKSLMTTERNFILSKGQTTVSLEKERIKGIEDRSIISILKELMKFKGSGS